MEELLKDIELQDCPICNGPALLEEESSHWLYVTCLDCGAHTAEVAFDKPSERLTAAKQVSHLWNIGKVLSSSVL